MNDPTTDTIAATPGHRSARDTARQLRSGSLDAADLARETLQNVATHDRALGAFAHTLTVAEASEAALRQQASGAALAGLPVAVKDIFDTADLPTGYGSPLGPGRRLHQDAAMVAVLKLAGAVVIGKATTTEFAFLHPTATLNPRAPGHTPGGSSAGSAAAVAAGLVPLAIGTQTGGSIIRPASYCGVVGYKPSFGWLPTVGMKCFSWSLDTVGLFAQDVADMAWFAEAVTGRPLQTSVSTGGATPVVAIPRSYPWGEPSPSATRAILAASEALRESGVEVRWVDLPPAAAAGFDAHAAIQGYEASRCLAHEFTEHRAALSPELASYLADAQRISGSTYAQAQQVATQARHDMAVWFNGCDALLTPSAPDEAPLGFASTGPSTFNRLWTLLGTPCINVPGLVGVSGCPMGLQLIGAVGSDARLLQVAASLEAALSRARGHAA